MCVVAGLLVRAGQLDLEDAARRMSAALMHRGPDGEGIWTDPAAGIALAHRRLAIIDLSPQGQQPMHSPRGRFVASFNGEIYNFRELRHCLDTEPDPPRWRGHSDTEVLLAAFEMWGIEETLRKSVGMFAIAVWDRRDRLLTLARDRLGEKPLYYGKSTAGFVFASELKAVRAVPGVSLHVDRQALAAFMQFGCVPAPGCIYTGLRKLQPGHFVVIHADGDVQEPQAYWTLKDRTTSSGRELMQTGDSELINLVHDQIAVAVRAQMISDVPIGAFLSGGVDSSLIVALMQAQSSRPIRTYTIGFEESEFDEAPFAAAVARHLGVRLHEIRVDATAMAGNLEAMVYQLDEPLADPAVDIATLAAVIVDEDEMTAHSVVKLIGSEIGPGRMRALYFTRATAPTGPGPLHHHVGLYAYRRAALRRFVSLPPSPLELREKLEQLRALEAGMRIDAQVIAEAPRGVDTPGDLILARELLRRRH